MNDSIYVTKPSMPPFEEYSNFIKEIWNNHWLTNKGKFHQEFQTKLKKYFYVENLELFTNGHMALELSLQALLENKKGAEIITTPFTFISTTNAIIRSGFTPVFCDINPNDFTLDVSKIESLLTEKTCAIVPVHVYGNVCNVEAIDHIAKKYNLKIIYDAAHAFGVCYKEKNIASFGDISIFSFHATKVFNSIEGGAACIKNKDVAKKISSLINFGILDSENVESIGTNAKMNEFCAVMGLCNLNHIDEYIAQRKKVYEKYLECLSGVSGIQINSIPKSTQSNYSYFPVVFNKKSRDEIFEFLAKHNIHARKYFFPLTNSFDCFKGKLFGEKFDVNKTPVALNISKRILTLPIYSDLSLNDVEKICNIVKQCLKN